MNGNEKDEYYFSSWMAEMLHNFEAYITRIEVHLSDEKAKKEVLNFVKCLLETRIEGRQPLAVLC